MCFTSEPQPSIWQDLLVKHKVTANLSCCLALGWGGAGGKGELHDAINTNYICLAILVTWEAEANDCKVEASLSASEKYN